MIPWKQILALGCVLAALAGCGGPSAEEEARPAAETEAAAPAAEPAAETAAPSTEAEPEPAPEIAAPETAPAEAETEPEVTMIFNQLEEGPSACLDYDLSELLRNRAELWDLETILDYWGRDLLPTAVPEDLAPAFDETSRWKYAAVPEEGLVWDQFAFQWEDPAGDSRRQLTVTVATEEPLDDCILVFTEDMLPSTVGGVEMLVGARQLEYGPYTDGPGGEKIPAGTYPAYEAQFRHQGLHFQVESYDLTEAEFTAALLSMVS